MAAWKLFCSWWTKHLFEIAAGTTVFALLAGGIAFAVVYAPTDRVVESGSSKIRENRSAAVALGSLEEPAPAPPKPEVPAEDQLDIVCPLTRALQAESAGAFGCMLGSNSENTTATPPAGYLEPAPIDPVAPAPGGAATDYSMECGPPLTTLMAFTTTNVKCEVRSGAFAGALNVKAISLDSANGSGPMLTISPPNFVLQPGGVASVEIAVDASNASLGTFRLGVTVQHGDAYNFSSSGDTGKSRTVEVLVTANREPPFIPYLPSEPRTGP